MKPACLLRVYILRRSRAADSFVAQVRMRFFRIVWKKMESMESVEILRRPARWPLDLPRPLYSATCKAPIEPLSRCGDVECISPFSKLCGVYAHYGRECFVCIQPPRDSS